MWGLCNLKLYTDTQQTKILGELLYLQKELGEDYFNNPVGEALAKSVDRIKKLILEGDEINCVVTK